MDPPDGEPLNVTQQDFYRKYLAKEWVIDDDSLVEGESLYEATPRDLHTFSARLQNMALRKQRYLDEIVKIQGTFVSTPAALQPIIRELAAQFQDPKPPSTTSVCRWHRRFSHGKSVANLVDRDDRKGRRPGIHGEVMEILERVIDEIFLNPQRNPAVAVHERLCGEIKRLNASRPNLPSLKPPSKATIYRYISNLEAYSVAVARFGKPEADRQFRNVKGQLTVTRILERWEIDHTPLDIILVVHLPDGVHTIGRPWMTVILDKECRMVMGFYLCLHAPSAQSVMNCLKHAILPKDEFLARFEDVKSEWPAHGLPETLVCDNGMDLHASAVASVCHELGIQLQFCPAKSPKYKGSVERFFRRVNEELIHTLPGTVFSNPRQRGDYASERLACIDMETLTHIVTKWIVDIYHQTPHKTLKTTPAAKWKDGLKERAAIELPADPKQLSIIMGIPVQRTLFHYGVEVNGLYYNAQPLQAIRRQRGENIHVDLKYYEEDLGHIHVFDEIHKEYFQVPAIQHAYASGLTLDQHEAITRMLKAQGQEAAGDIFERRLELRALIFCAQRSKKMANRKEAARLIGLDSEQPRGKLRDTSSPQIVSSSPNEQSDAEPNAFEQMELPSFKVTPRLDVPNDAFLWSSDDE